MSDALEDYLPDVVLEEASTSYFSDPENDLDPALFVGDHLRTDVRAWVLNTVYACWDHHFAQTQQWTTVWIAGSGASYQWAAAREPGDLDILIGVDYPQFRRCNPLLAGMSDTEISEYLNETSRAELYPATAAVQVGDRTFEVTWYVNPGATDITTIHPYAAYDVSHDRWTVHPDQAAKASRTPELDAVAQRDHDRASDLLASYQRALAAVRQARLPHERVNAKIWLHENAREAARMFGEIHTGRKAAFAPTGTGYLDVANYRWQAGKASGVVQALGKIHQGLAAWDQAQQEQLYGAPIDAPGKLLRRALAYRSVR